MTVSKENCNLYPLDYFCLPPFKKSGYRPVCTKALVVYVSIILSIIG